MRISKLLVFIVVFSCLLYAVSISTSTLAAAPTKSKKAAALPLNILNSSKYAALVLDEKTGKILYEKNARLKRNPASITKNLTLYLTFEALDSGKLKLNQRLPISQEAASKPPTRLGLKAGNTITVRDAIDGLIVKSANDAAVVLAEAIAGTEWQFVKMMNRKAKQLGLHDSQFANSHGLHYETQYSTAYDLAKLALCLIKHHPKYYPMFNKTSFSFEGKIIVGHNRVMNRYHGAEGMKTGYIAASGFNLVTVVKRPQGRLIGVVLGGQTPKIRDDHMIEILDKGYITLASATNPNMLYAQLNTKEDAKVKEEDREYRDSGELDVFEEAEEQEKFASDVFRVLKPSAPKVQLAKVKSSSNKVMSKKVSSHKGKQAIVSKQKGKKVMKAANSNSKKKRTVTAKSKTVIKQSRA